MRAFEPVLTSCWKILFWLAARLSGSGDKDRLGSSEPNRGRAPTASRPCSPMAANDTVGAPPVGLRSPKPDWSGRLRLARTALANGRLTSTGVNAKGPPDQATALLKRGMPGPTCWHIASARGSGLGSGATALRSTGTPASRCSASARSTGRTVRRKVLRSHTIACDPWSKMRRFESLG